MQLAISVPHRMCWIEQPAPPTGWTHYGRRKPVDIPGKPANTMPPRRSNGEKPKHTLTPIALHPPPEYNKHFHHNPPNISYLRACLEVIIWAVNDRFRNLISAILGPVALPWSPKWALWEPKISHFRFQSTTSKHALIERRPEWPRNTK